MSYIRTNWVNDQTPLNADNMNNIEDGIEQALAQGGAIVITSGGSTTEKTFTIPTLTNKQVVDAYNALASGKPCIIDSQDGDEHYNVDNANASTIAINIVYSNKLIVTYTENSGAETDNATISSVELGGNDEADTRMTAYGITCNIAHQTIDIGGTTYNVGDKVNISDLASRVNVTTFVDTVSEVQ